MSLATAILAGDPYDLGLPYQGLTEQVLRLAVTESCLEFYREGGKTLIVVDEAHHLMPTLEELRLRATWRGTAARPCRCARRAAGNRGDYTEAGDVGAAGAYGAAKLEPLDVDESADYLMHQIREAGGRPERISARTCWIFCHAANGIPRDLNQAAHPRVRAGR